MLVLMLERVPVGLRGELSRWMIEPRTGVFVGRVTAMVRDRLWQKARRGAKGGAGMMVYLAQTEQGFAVDQFGDANRTVVNLDGLLLVHIARQSRHAPMDHMALEEEIAGAPDERETEVE